VYYLRKPCSPREAVEVRPWWERARTVRVCPDSYRPDVLHDPQGRYCGGSYLNASYSPVCGCGPALAFCWRDPEQLDEVGASLKREALDTAAAVVGADRPLAAIFADNETVRDRNAEFIYRRWAIANGADPGILDDLAAWPQAPIRARRAERFPGQHAGVLTTERFLYQSSGPRDRMKDYEAMLWCTDVNSVRVTAEAIFALGSHGDLREGERGMELAHRPVCTDCHARLDYAMQFFDVWPAAYRSTNLVATSAHPTEVGRMYVRDADDLRGEAPRTPLRWARLATAQPEFATCMGERVLDHVLGGAAAPEDASRLAAIFARSGGRLAPMVAYALERYGERRLQLLARPSPPGDTPVHPALGGSRLGALVADSCLGCHDAGLEKPDLSAAVLEPELTAKMLDRVAFGVMPPPPRRLDPQARVALVRELLRATRLDGDAAAASHYLAGTDPITAHRQDVLLGIIDARAGAPGGVRWDTPELGALDKDRGLTPNIAAIAGLEALASCRRAGHAGDALRRCIRASASGDVVSDRAMPP
jgi:hypothetical protein